MDRICYVDLVVIWAAKHRTSRTLGRWCEASGLLSTLLSILQSDPMAPDGIHGRYGQAVGTAKPFRLS